MIASNDRSASTDGESESVMRAKKCDARESMQEKKILFEDSKPGRMSQNITCASLPARCPTSDAMVQEQSLDTVKNLKW